MTKTTTTKLLEEKLHQYTHKLGTYGCVEVKIGFPKTARFMTNTEEFVDYMSVSSDGIIKCYEIKTSKSDVKSMAKLSFLGHYNYLVLPLTLYNTIKTESWFKSKIPTYVGILTFNNTTFETPVKPKKQSISIGMQTMLLESLTRSLSREANKYYKQLYSGEINISNKEYQQLLTDSRKLKRLEANQSKMVTYSKRFDLAFHRLRNTLLRNKFITDTIENDPYTNPEIVLNCIIEKILPKINK